MVNGLMPLIINYCLIKKILHTVFIGNLFISIASIAFVIPTFLLNSKPINSAIVSFVFLSTMLIYHLSRYASFIFKTENTIIHSWFIENRTLIKFIIVACVLGLCCVVFFMKTSSIVFACHLGCISFLYFVPMAINKTLRNIPFLKIFVISYVWASVSTYLPLEISFSTIFEQKNLLFFTYRFLFIFAITIPFDIRDNKVDHTMGIKTITNSISINYIRSIYFILFFVIFLFQNKLFELSRFEMILSLIFCLFSLVVCLKSEKKENYLYYFGLIDGLILILSILEIIFII